MSMITVEDAANRLGVSPMRVRVLIREGRLPASSFGKAYAIDEKDLALVANRKPGRPKTKEPANTKKASKK